VSTLTALCGPVDEHGMIRARRALTVLTVVLLVTAGVAATGTIAGQSDSTEKSNESGWSAPRADAGHAGVTTDDGPGPYANTSWAQGNTSRGYWSPAVAGDSVVMAYTGNEYPYGIVESYDETTGETEWVQDAVGDPVGPATTANGSVFVATKSDTREFSGYENRTGLYALDAETGAVDWRLNSTFTAPVVADGTVYTSERSLFALGPEDDYTGNVTALDPASGDRRWTSDVQGKVLAVADGRVIVGDQAADTLAAVDADDGTLLWRTSVGDDVSVDGEIAVTADAIYAQSDAGAGSVVSFDASDGSKRWETEVGDDVVRDGSTVTAPAVANGSVYVVTNTNPSRAGYGARDDAEVQALDARTGDVEWTFRTRVNLQSPPAVGNGTVHVGGVYQWGHSIADDRSWDERQHARWRYPYTWVAAYALDAENGSEQWNLLTDSGQGNEQVYGSALADGRFYVTSYGTGLPGTVTLTAIEGTDDRPPWYFHTINDQDFGDANVPPDAEVVKSPPPGDDGSYAANTTVTLSASASSDPDGNVTTYGWDVDDDGEYETTGVSIDVQSPDEAGASKDVTLRVTDDDGDTDEAFVQLETGC